MKLQQVIERLVALQPQSRQDLKDQVAELLASDDLRIIDTHNTNSIIYVFTADAQRYGLKIEYGEAKVTRDEVHWYNKVPLHLRQHFVSSALEENLAFVVLRWFDDAPTIEQLAARGDASTMDLYLGALAQDEELYASSGTVTLHSSQDSSFFKDKFYRELERVKAAEGWYLYDMLTSDRVVLNGRVMPGPAQLVERIHADDRVRNYLSPDQAGFIHGDMHAGNLVADGDDVYMIDPNGHDYIPIEYDQGRIHWSMTGWNQIIEHNHQLEVLSDNQYTLEVPVHQCYVEGADRFAQHVNKYGQSRGLQPGQGYHRAVYSSAMQYLSRGTHVAVEHEALGLHLRGLEQLVDLCRQLAEAGIITEPQRFIGE